MEDEKFFYYKITMPGGDGMILATCLDPMWYRIEIDVMDKTDITRISQQEFYTLKMKLSMEVKEEDL